MTQLELNYDDSSKFTPDPLLDLSTDEEGQHWAECFGMVVLARSYEVCRPWRDFAAEVGLPTLGTPEIALLEEMRENER